MVTLGVLIRIEANTLSEVESSLNALAGVTTLPLEEAGTLGAIVHAPNLDAAHSMLCDRIQKTEGVLCAHPIHTELASTNQEESTPAIDTVDSDALSSAN